MSASIDETLAIPPTDDVFKLGDIEGLRKALVIGAPSTPEKTPPSLTFQRKRDVEIPWREVFSGIEIGIQESVEALRLDLEQSVAQPGKTLEFLDDADAAALLPYYAALGVAPAAKDDAEPAPPLKAYRPTFTDPEKPATPPPAGKPPPPDIVVTPQEIPTGVVFRHGSGRVYLLLTVEGETLALADFADAQSYKQAWSNKISGVELVYLEQNQAIENASEFEEIDLAARVIESKFKELLELCDYQTALDVKAAAVIDGMLENAVQNNLDLDEVERIQNKGLQIKMGLQRIKSRIKRLSGQASDLGYILFDKDNTPPVDSPDAKGEPLQAGVLYQKYRRVAKWTTVSTISRTVRQTLRILFVNVVSKRVVKQQVQQQHSRVVDDYRPVDTSRDLLAEKVSELRAAGFNVNVFRNTPQGYMSEQNVSLDAVMEECGRDERTRVSCAVILPIFEESMSGRRALIKYHVFKRPLPGIQPTAMPRLTLVESLSYRLAWTGAQLGEVVSTLNLAPGESRTITMRKQYETETTITESRSSVFDLDRQESTDLSDEMEDQMRAEAEHSDETSMSMNVSGSYGFVSGSANASHGSKNSLKNFSQAINKVAKKSSQSINKKQREEVSTTSTSRTKVSTFDETTAKIENINQGRTLNLMFYRLYNRFASGLFIEGLRFQVLSSVETIAGSGVQRSNTYSFDSFADMIDEFGNCALPFRVSPADKYNYLTNVLDAVSALIETEYKRAPKRVTNAIAPSRSVSVLKLGVAPDSGGASTPPQAVDPDLEEQLRKLQEQKDAEAKYIKELQAKRDAAKACYAKYLARRDTVAAELRGATLDSAQALEGTEQELLVVAPGLYLDSNLGVQPATEVYSEAMRAQRVRQEAADVALKSAEAQYKLSLAARLQGKALRAGQIQDNWITGIMADQASSTVRLKLKFPLEQGDWQLYVDGEAIATKSSTMIGETILAVECAKADAWLGRDDLMTSAIELRDDDNGRVLSAVI